jgi:hypothetical protein
VEDRNAGLDVRRLNVRDQAALESRHQSLFEKGDVLGRAITRHDDLPAGFVERVERRVSPRWIA